MAALKTQPKGRDVEVDGIKLTVSIDPQDDYELAETSIILADSNSTNSEKARAVMKRNALLLGDDKQRVLDELRAKHGGKLSGEVVNSFVIAVAAQAVEAKN